MKELSMLFAFILVGSLLLLSFWLTRNIDSYFLSEFKNDKLSVVIESGREEDFRAFAESHGSVLNYRLHSSDENKALLQKLYPELKTVIEDLEAEFFPVSATMTVSSIDQVTKDLAALGGFVRERLSHQAPENLQFFLQIITSVFLVLWIMTMFLMLYFQLERLGYRESRKWSLMKMLGAKPIRIFWPICGGQIARIFLASVFAIFLAHLATLQFNQVFAWGWPSLNLGLWLGFVASSLILSGVILFVLFVARFRQVSLG